MKPTNKIKLLKQAIKGEITKRSEHILEEYKNVFILTINEPDFPRKWYEGTIMLYWIKMTKSSR